MSKAAGAGGQTSVNENTSTVSEPSVVSGGSGVTSFDELEGLHALASARANEKRSAPSDDEDDDKPAKTKPKKEKVENDDEDESDDQGDDEEVDSDDDGDGKLDAKAKEKDEKNRDKKDENAKEKFKILKARAGDEELDLRSDAVLEAKVDGKIEKVSVQDLLNNYSGKVSYEKKFTDLDKERKAFQGERQDLQSSIDNLFRLAVTEKKPQEAIEMLAEAMGGDPVEVWKNLRTTIWDQFKKVRDLSDEDIAALDEKDELESLRARDKRRTADEAKRKERDELDTRSKAVQEKYNLNDAGFVQAYDELVKSGTIKADQITPEAVGEFYEKTQTLTAIDSFLTELNPEIDGKEKKVSDLYKEMKSHGLKLEDMREIATQLYSTKSTKGLAKKIKNAKPTDTSRSPNKNQNEPFSFDDL